MKEAILKVDLDNILYNYRHIKCYYKKNIIAILKDDAYGLGLIEIAKTLQYEEGIIIGVSSLDEIIKLRKSDYQKEILYLNVFDEGDLNIILDNDVNVIVENLNQLKLLKNTKIKFHLKFNTGMNRLGLKDQEAISSIKEVNNNSNKYNLVGLMTHLADEDEDHQCYERFKNYVEKVKKDNLIIHCFSSSSLKENFDDITNYVRVGIKLYGLSKRNLFLHNAIHLSCPILSIKEVNKYEKVGYDYSYTTKDKGYLYILPLGYGHGWGRFENSIGFIKDTYLYQAGKISMDYSTYFSTKLIDINEKIQLIGSKTPFNNLAEMNHMDFHELLLRLKNIKKEYIKKTI